MRHLLKCPSCSNYTLEPKCICGTKTLTPIPPKYSPEDKYGSYRREAKQEIYKKKGFL